MIVDFVVAFLHSRRELKKNDPLNRMPYFLEYGILDWAWPLRFTNNNEPYKAYLYYSKNAVEALRSEKKVSLKRDHVFPKYCLKEKLYELDEPDANTVKGLLQKYGEICVITDEEHERLNTKKLGKCMPSSWKEGEDIFDRYRAVEIEKWKNDQLFLDD